MERYRDCIHYLTIDLFVSIALFTLFSLLKIKLAYIQVSEKNRAIKINRPNHSLIKTDFCSLTISIDIIDLFMLVSVFTHIIT